MKNLRKKIKKLRRDRGDQRGQVIVEFLIVMSILFTMIFLFVQMSWGIAWGHYVHYATYMSSRAYMAAGQTKGDQYEAAGAYLRQMLKKSGGADMLPFLSPSRAGGDRDANGSEPISGAMVGMHPEAMGKEKSRLFSWAEGVQYNFNVRMFLLPISKLVTASGQGKNISPGSAQSPGRAIQWRGVIPFTSDSFLGREPSTSECFEEMRRLSGILPRGDGATFIEDNGC